jgi:hypothetical protein
VYKREDQIAHSKNTKYETGSRMNEDGKDVAKSDKYGAGQGKDTVQPCTGYYSVGCCDASLIHSLAIATCAPQLEVHHAQPSPAKSGAD